MADCSTSTLASNSNCFSYLDQHQQAAIQTYLLAMIAGGSTDPETLAVQAKCFECLSEKELAQIQAYLLCQIVG